MNPDSRTGQDSSLADIMEAGSRDFRRQSIEQGSDLSLWTKLYVANQTMLSALQQRRMSEALVEICSNLLGCEELAIIEINRETGKVQFVTVEGLQKEKTDFVASNGRQVEGRISPGNPYVCADPESTIESELVDSGISAIVPLWVDVRSSGALILFQLLPQRSGFDAEDREVLNLLSIFAGPCLRSQRRD